MNTKYHRHLLAAGLAAAGLSLSYAGTLAPDAQLTRAEVREELKDARASNRMTPSGEIGDTAEVLAARESFNVRQTETMLARHDPYQPVAAASQALDELVAEIEALDAESDMVAALVGSDD